MSSSWHRAFPFLLAWCSLAALPASATSQQEDVEPDSSAVVEGTVVSEDSGQPLYGATVSLGAGPGGTPGAGTRVSNEEGWFFFRSVPPGSYSVVVSLLGYHTLRDTIVVEPASSLEIQLRLSVSPIVLEPITVVATRRRSPALEGFERRRRRGFGRFITRDEIEERNPLYVTDLLRLVPGARVVPMGLSGHAVRLRGGCQPEIWVDGVRTSGDSYMSMDHFLPTQNVEAVEVYHSTQMPIEFGANSCGAIVVWTRVPERGPGEGSFWDRRLLVAAGIVLLSFIFIR